MEPCPNKLGVLFNSEELPTVVEVLEEYVSDSRFPRSATACEVYRELVDLRHEKYGYWGGAFVPAAEALTVSKALERQAQKENDTSTVIVPGFFGMVHVAVPLSSQRKHRFALAIEKTVRQSKDLQS